MVRQLACHVIWGAVLNCVLAGCGNGNKNDGGNEASSAPRVVGTVPADGAVDVSFEQSVQDEHPVLAANAAGPKPEQETGGGGYEIVKTCADCPRSKRGRELVLRNSEGQTTKSWWMGTQKTNRKVLPMDDPRVLSTIAHYRSAGVSLDHNIFVYDETKQSVYLPRDSVETNAVASAAILLTDSALILDFMEFDYPHDDPQAIQPQESSIQHGGVVLGENGDVLWSFNQQDNATYASGRSWISQGASVVGLLHFEVSVGFYVQFYDKAGTPTWRLPPESFSEHAGKVTINSGHQSTVLSRTGEHFVLSVSFPKKGEYEGLRKYERGTFVLDTDTGHIDYFNGQVEANEAVARFVANPPPPQRPSSPPPVLREYPTQ